MKSEPGPETMRRPGKAVYLVGGVAIAFALIMWFKRSEESPDSVGTDTYTENRKVEIAQFWQRYNDASQYRRTGDFESAVTSYREARHLNDRHEDTLYYLGNTLTELGRHAEAAEVFQDLIGHNALSARGHFQLGFVLSISESPDVFDLEGARAAFERAFEINPEQSGPTVRRGEIALVTESFSDATRLLEDTVRLNPKAVTAIFLLGYLEWLEGNEAGAGKRLAEVRIQGRDEAPPGGVLGEGDTKSGQPLEALKYGLFAGQARAAAAESSGGATRSVQTTFEQFHLVRSAVTARWRSTRSD